MTSRRAFAGQALGGLLLAACGSNSDTGTEPVAAAPAAAPPATRVELDGRAMTAVAPAPARVGVATVASGLANPWSLAFLPGGRKLVTERPGRLRVIEADGSVGAPLAGVPTVFAQGQGGLLDVVVSPGFASDATIFFSYAEPNGTGGARAAVARARLGATALSNVQVIFRQSTSSTGGAHFGSRIVFAEDGRLWVTLGEHNLRQPAQDLASHLGKVIRIDVDGSVPPDNPFVATAGARPELFSLGHRNPQGAARHPATGRLWVNEHGPKGGDEVNVVRAGANHGWPTITYGREYDTGLPIGEGTAKDGIVAPVHYWVPVSIAPSGMAFYTGTAVPGWRDSVFIGAMAAQALVRLSLSGETVVGEERLLTGLGRRIRDVRMGPDGELYLLTDEADGRLLRVVVT